jgi:predicted  nucleic acid-binding Zn-ribbon protein
MHGASVGESESRETRWSQILQRSVETRMRSIQEKISIAFTFCSTVETEIQYGHFDRAKELLNKLRSTVESLTSHINNPAHVSGKQAKEFREQLVQLRKQLLRLESQIERR